MKKILLIHGWNYRNYYGHNKDAWHNRESFVKELEKYYEVIKLDLPGFGLNPEPNKKKYSVEDYTDYVHNFITENNYKFDYILGYSFGGAIASIYKKKYGNIKLILVSPALVRNTSKRKFIKTPKIFNPIRNLIRNLYTIHILKVPEMVYGTKFLRKTYQDIVRVELLDIIENFDPKDYIIIYGDKDNMVDPSRVLNTVSKHVLERIILIKNGCHDIANTHTKEIVEIINKKMRF